MSGWVTLEQRKRDVYILYASTAMCRLMCVNCTLVCCDGSHQAVLRDIEFQGGVARCLLVIAVR